MIRAGPLAPPGPDSPALRAFLAHFGIDRRADPGDLLRSVAAAFARIPYENLTKILKEARECRSPRARRGPEEVVTEHAQLGTGGTCFSLTAALLHILRALGVPAEPILADRRYGEDTHSALLVSINGRPHLLDPGYLIVEPVPVPRAAERTLRRETAFNTLRLEPRSGSARLDLHTEEKDHSTYRLTYKLEPADPERFLAAWDASFGWDMMRYPLLTRVVGGEQLYLQARKLQRRTAAHVERGELAAGDLAAAIAREFGIDRGVVARALDVLRRRGEANGW